MAIHFFFFNDTATTEIYTLSLHDALPISTPCSASRGAWRPACRSSRAHRRSEEHTSELQSPCNLVCRLLLEKNTWSAKSPTSLRSASEVTSAVTFLLRTPVARSWCVSSSS